MADLLQGLDDGFPPVADVELRLGEEPLGKMGVRTG